MELEQNICTNEITSEELRHAFLGNKEDYFTELKEEITTLKIKLSAHKEIIKYLMYEKN